MIFKHRLWSNYNSRKQLLQSGYHQILKPNMRAPCPFTRGGLGLQYSSTTTETSKRCLCRLNKDSNKIGEQWFPEGLDKGTSCDSPWTRLSIAQLGSMSGSVPSDWWLSRRAFVNLHPSTTRRLAMMKVPRGIPARHIRSSSAVIFSFISWNDEISSNLSKSCPNLNEFHLS